MMGHYQKLVDELAVLAPAFFAVDIPKNIPAPYIFVWGVDSDMQSLTGVDVVDATDDWFKISVVGETAHNAGVLAEQVAALLPTLDLTIPGWHTERIRGHDIEIHGPISSGPVFEDSTNQKVGLMVLDARLRATIQEGKQE